MFLSLLISTFARAPAYSSLLTDAENKTSTTLEGKHAWNDVDFLRQMINQETVIRLSLVKNVQALVSDVNLMKKSITINEMTISALQQTIETLNVRMGSMEKENKRLKESSNNYQETKYDLETTLETVNLSVNSLNENLDTVQKQNDEKRGIFLSLSLISRITQLRRTKLKIKNSLISRDILTRRFKNCKLKISKPKESLMKLKHISTTWRKFKRNFRKPSQVRPFILWNFLRK